MCDVEMRCVLSFFSLYSIYSSEWENCYTVQQLVFSFVLCVIIERQSENEERERVNERVSERDTNNQNEPTRDRKT